ncbi:MAG: hypothetical protein RL095_78 [Verrucomicrobiota bacterium]|jgi:homoserine/homoserine lactone efflux protein
MTAFILSCCAFSISPGPGALCSIQKSLRQGRTAAFVSLAGLQAALLLHLIAVATGLGALFAKIPSLQQVVGFLGASWFLFLAWQRWNAATALPEESPRRRLGQEFLDGFLVNLGNPKSILFLVAFLPSFIRSDAPPLPQFAKLGSLIVGIDILVMSGYILAALSLSRFFREDATRRRLDRLFALVFAALAIFLAWRSLA